MSPEKLNNLPSFSSVTPGAAGESRRNLSPHSHRGLSQVAPSDFNGNIKAYLRHLLERHVGHANAITAKTLSRILDGDERQVRIFIRELIAGGLPIASTTRLPYGYFIIETWEEAKQYATSIKNRLIEDAYRRRDFNKSVALHLEKAKQGRLL